MEAVLTQSKIRKSRGFKNRLTLRNMRRWREALIMLAVHLGLFAYYCLLLRMFPLFQNIYAELGAELPWLTLKHIHEYEQLNSPLIIALQFGALITVDMAGWAILRWCHPLLGLLWITGIAFVFILLIATAPVSAFLPMFAMPMLIGR